MRIRLKLSINSISKFEIPCLNIIKRLKIFVHIGIPIYIKSFLLLWLNNLKYLTIKIPINKNDLAKIIVSSLYKLGLNKTLTSMLFT